MNCLNSTRLNLIRSDSKQELLQMQNSPLTHHLRLRLRLRLRLVLSSTQGSATNIKPSHLVKLNNVVHH